MINDLRCLDCRPLFDIVGFELKNRHIRACFPPPESSGIPHSGFESDTAKLSAVAARLLHGELGSIPFVHSDGIAPLVQRGMTCVPTSNIQSESPSHRIAISVSNATLSRPPALHVQS